jgi:adenosylcobinamide-GDP ribazoletransferase
MDCSDAIMSRRPELEERQRILKDSTVGAFAVICVVLMFMIFAASAAALAGEWAMPFGYAKGSVSPLGFNLLNKFLVLAGIMVTSRYIAAADVLRQPAMSTSQYAKLGDAKEPGFGGREGVVLGLVSSFLIVIMMFITTWLPGGMLSRLILVYCGAVLAVALTAGITGYRDRKNLGGMNGDIAGHMITMSEMMGMAAAAVVFAAV